MFLDGLEQGKTPLSLQIEVGRNYALAVRKTGYKSLERSLALRGPGKLNHSLEYTPERLFSLNSTRTEWLGFDLHLGVAGNEMTISIKMRVSCVNKRNRGNRKQVAPVLGERQEKTYHFLVAGLVRVPTS